MTVNRRGSVVTVRFTESEAEALRRAADRAGKSVSALLREVTMAHIKPPRGASVSSTTGMLSYSVTATGTGLAGQAMGEHGQPVGGNLEVLTG